MESESAALVPPLYPVDLSPLLAESAGGTFALEPFTAEDRIGDEHFTAAVRFELTEPIAACASLEPFAAARRVPAVAASRLPLRS